MKKVLRGFAALIAAVILMAGCGSNNSSDSDYYNGTLYDSVNDGTTTSVVGDTTFSTSDQNYLYKLFLTEYYWSDKVETGLDVSVYNEPQTMINVLKYSELDHWSFVYTLEQYNDFSTQKNSGFGFAYDKNATGDFVVYWVLLSSPADTAGLKRGDVILKINGKEVTEELITTLKAKLGSVATYEVLRGTETITLSITPAEYTFKVTSATTVTTPLGKKVGYLRFDSFTDTATDEIEAAFDYLSTQSIDTLVIDMRYNGGGYLNTASILLDKLVRNHDGLTQFTLSWNNDYSTNNETATFETDTNSIDLKQIVFLTTNETASASEMVINALRATALSVDVVLVGGTTHGKPVGMSGKIYGGFVYFLINFVVTNADGFSDYFDGFAPTCGTADDIMREMGDPDEGMLKEALHYIDEGACS